MLGARDLCVIQCVYILCAQTCNCLDISLTRTFLLQYIVVTAYPPCSVPTSTLASVYESVSCISLIFLASPFYSETYSASTSSHPVRLVFV
jgi:hypothetical protein